MSGAAKFFHVCSGRSPEIACLELAHILTKAALPVAEPHLAPQRRKNKWRKTTFRGACVTHPSKWVIGWEVWKFRAGTRLTSRSSGLHVDSIYPADTALIQRTILFGTNFHNFFFFTICKQILWSFSAIPLISFTFFFATVRIYSESCWAPLIFLSRQWERVLLWI